MVRISKEQKRKQAAVRVVVDSAKVVHLVMEGLGGRKTLAMTPAQRLAEALPDLAVKRALPN